MYDEGHRSGAAGTDATDNATTTTEAPELAGSPVLVRRNAGVAAAIGAVASAVAIAYLWRAVQGGSPLDWALCGVIALLAGFHLGALIDARTPLVVADDLGVRIRLGQQWRGLPWDAVALVEVRPRSRLLGDGRLVFRPHNVDRALDGLDAAARRAAKVNERLHGAPLAVPLGLTTRASGRGPALADELAALARGRATVELTVPQTTGTGSDADETPTTDELPDAGPAPDTTPDTVPDAVRQRLTAS